MGQCVTYAQSSKEESHLYVGAQIDITPTKPYWKIVEAGALHSSTKTSTIDTRADGVLLSGKKKRTLERQIEFYRPISIHHREKGKEARSQSKFEIAIQELSRAIDYYPLDSNYFLSRARCYRDLNDWKSAAEDCEQVLLLDPKNIKANYLLSLSLYRNLQPENPPLQDMQRIIKHIDIAYELLRMKEGKSELLQQLRIDRCFLRKKYSGLAAEERKTRSKDMKEYMKNLIESQEEGAALYEEFLQLVPNESEPEVPDFLNCKISLDLLREPLLTQDGMTYGAAELRQYLQKMGKKDPITRRELDIEKTVPNKTILDCLAHFIDRNPWAFDETSEQFSLLSLIHISEPTRLLSISYAVFCLKKKNQQ
eukprot:TRINITY_DN1281_c0_g1_i8.p1 TRINITY_DN1281_c0_g1~~TRINITY_DN1281_c0_g1_i8.p1  ORF type:complete len:367 (+),score=60.51 TRINITY_DN1281_c0_g1_i8:128-1228(+)